MSENTTIPENVTAEHKMKHGIHAISNSDNEAIIDPIYFINVTHSEGTSLKRQSRKKKASSNWF